MNPSAPSGSVYNTTVLEGESRLNASVPADTGSTETGSRPVQLPAQLPEEPAQTFTLNDALNAYGFGRTQIIMFFFCGLAWAGDGMEMLLISYLGPEVRASSWSACCFKVNCSKPA